MKFYYTASQLNGKLVKGEIEALNAAEALSTLAKQGLKPISLKKEEGSKKFVSRLISRGSISVGDKIFITKYLSLMLRIGTDLLRAVDILIVDFEKPAVKSFLFEIRDGLEKGQPFYAAFAKYPRYFSQVFVNLIKAGEVSGNLEKALDRLSVSLQKQQDLRHQIRSALVYPILLITVSLIILFTLVTFALPKIANLFVSSGVEPPIFSKIIFSIGLFLNDNLIIVLVLIFLAVLVLVFMFTQSVAFRKIFQRLARKTPFVGKVLREVDIQNFTSTFASLLSSGLPILDALEVTANAVGDQELKTSILRISKEGIAKGLTIGEAFRRETIFPRVVVNLISISEKGGNLESILFTLSDFYESEITSSIKILVSFLEPFLLFVMGFIVGVIALATIIPIYQLIGKF